MARERLSSAVNELHGATSPGHIHRVKHFRDAQGRIIGIGVQETYDVLHPRDYKCNPADTFAVLDWGRGVWTYDNTWYWGSASGLVDNHPFGFNIGYGFGDTSAASENVILFDGKIHKLSRVMFNIPMKNGKEDYISPWTFTSDDGRFEMQFIPVMDRASKTDLGVICSDQHQVFGRFNGKVILDDRNELLIQNLTGFAEKVHNNW